MRPHRILPCLAAFCAIALLTSISLEAQTKKTDKSAKSKPSSTSAKAPAKHMEQANPLRPQYLMTVKHGAKTLGTITLEMFADVAPKHAANFDSLVAIKFYDGTAFHRIIPGFMIQGGDPNSRANSNMPKQMWGTGQPGQKNVPAEFSTTLKHEPGIISAARTNDPNSATSQFFICHGAPSHLDGQYSIFGRVVSGMEVVDQIARVPLESGGSGSSPLEKVEMTIVKK
jgi:peptidyl-prolyl cis-trans isomerase B (cyclophilin B)